MVTPLRRPALYGGQPERSCGAHLGCNRRCPGIPSLLVLVFFFVALCHALGVTAEKKRYLLPILPYGPCNQVASLKEVMVLGKLLGRTVIVHKLFNHWTDAKYHKVRAVRPNIGASSDHRTGPIQQQQQQGDHRHGMVRTAQLQAEQRPQEVGDSRGVVHTAEPQAGQPLPQQQQQLGSQAAAASAGPPVPHRRRLAGVVDAVDASVAVALQAAGCSGMEGAQQLQLQQFQLQQEQQQRRQGGLPGRAAARGGRHHRRLSGGAGAGPGGGDGGGPVAQQLLDFDEMYNRQVLATYSDIATLDEFRRDTGWDGKLKALLYSNSRHLPQMERSEILYGMDIGKAAYLHVVSPFNCSAPSIVLLRAWLARYDVVGALLYEEVVPNSGHNVRLYSTGDVCHDAYLNVSAKLVKSDTVVAWADSFIAQHVDNQTFVAVHIRPYPDSCLVLWEAPNATLTLEATTRAKCTNRNLYRIAANYTAQHMARLNTTVLFVVAHPLIRAKVNRMYASAGIRPVYYDMADLEAQPGGRRCVTLLSMVEAEVAVRAAVFLGTPQSSMSGMIMQERAARGMDKYSTLFFPRTT